MTIETTKTLPFSFRKREGLLEAEVVVASYVERPPRFRLDRLWRACCDNWVLAIALAPVLRLILTSSEDGSFTSLQDAERFVWISAFSAEFFVIIVALQKGLDVRSLMAAAPRGAQIAISVWIIALGISTGTATGAPHLAIVGAAQWLTHGLFALSLWFLGKEHSEHFVQQFRTLCNVYPWVSLLVGILAMIFILVLDDTTGRAWVKSIPGFAHIRHTGYLFAPALAICAARVAIEPRRKTLPVLLLAGNTALCLWFGSRGPVAGLMLGVIAALLLCEVLRRRSAIGSIVIAMMVGALASLAVPTPPGQGFGALSRVVSVNSDASVDSLTSGRLTLWSDAGQLIAKRPIFGHGAHQFQFTSDHAQGQYKHPHNFVLQALFEWGAVGGIALFYLLAAAMFKAMNSRARASHVYPAGIIGFTTMAGMAIIDGTFYYPQTILLTLLFLNISVLRFEKSV